MTLPYLIASAPILDWFHIRSLSTLMPAWCNLSLYTLFVIKASLFFPYWVLQSSFCITMVRFICTCRVMDCPLLRTFTVRFLYLSWPSQETMPQKRMFMRENSLFYRLSQIGELRTSSEMKELGHTILVYSMVLDVCPSSFISETKFSLAGSCLNGDPVCVASL